jgi:hypothetical protein
VGEFILPDLSEVLLEAQDADQYHRVRRFGFVEPVLAWTVNLLLRASTVFDARLADAAALYFQRIEPAPPFHAAAEPGAAPDRPR